MLVHSSSASAKTPYTRYVRSASGVATLVDGGEPESFPKVEASLESVGAGLKEVCDAAIKATAAEGGTKGVIEDRKRCVGAGSRRAQIGRGSGVDSACRERQSRNGND